MVEEVLHDDLKELEIKITNIKYLMKDHKNIKKIEIQKKEVRHLIRCYMRKKVSLKKRIKFMTCLFSFSFYFYLERIWGMIYTIWSVAFRGGIAKQEFHLNKEKKLIYINNPKVACTSLKSSLHNFLEKKTDYNEIHEQADRRGSVKKQLRINEYDKYHIFSFVRSPFQRLISCYENKYHSDKKYLGMSIYKLYFDTYLFGYLKEDQGFTKFAEKVTKIPDFLADAHFKSQYATLYIKGRGLPDYIGKFENLAEDFEPLRRKYDLAPLPHYNSTAKERGGKNWMDYYDLHTAELVYKRYKKDFEVFGYEDEYHNLIAYLKAKEA